MSPVPENKPQEETVKSPCVSVCKLNKENICIACFRSLSEIAEWSQADKQRKESILQAAYQRGLPEDTAH